MITLDDLAKTSLFANADKTGRAELIICMFYSQDSKKNGVTIKQVNSAFKELELVEANITRLRDQLRRSKNVRSLNGKGYGPTREFLHLIQDELSEAPKIPDDIFDVSEIELPPYVPKSRQEDLAKMVKAYAHLFLLENSMRGLIHDVLSNKLGTNWWDIAANKGMKKKHSDRIENEKTKKWAPARSDFGPLYALDWPDLITLMRKYHNHFEPILKNINFLHRYDDAGTFRNVVAHNGVLRNQEDFDLIKIYYRNWIQQVG